MSLQPQAAYPIPEETVRVAQAAFPHGSQVMLLRDTLGMLSADIDFAALFPSRGQPAASPSRLFLITILQFMENLPDRQAADAVRSRIDWKYALGLELTDAGFNFSVLSEFRARLLQDGPAQRYLDRLLDDGTARGWLSNRGRQRTDSTHIVAAIRALNRLEHIGETLRHTLDVLAVVAPDWLKTVVPHGWFERYAARFTDFRLPKQAPARQAYAEQIGHDGQQLLQLLEAPSTPTWLRKLPAVVVLRQVWQQQFVREPGRLRWRADAAMPDANELLQSPYDVDARYSTKRSTSWVGYKLHLTETCDAATPHLIVHVATTPATLQDNQSLATIHDALAAHTRLPAEHLVDSGYVDADTLLASAQDHGVELVGRIQGDHSWQAKAGNGFDSASFKVDWDRQQVVCPQGQTNRVWKAGRAGNGDRVIHVAFAQRTCAACPVRRHCTRSASMGRELTLRPRAQHEAIAAARQQQSTAAFRERYAQRAGIEGTIAEGTRICGLRRSRYRGAEKTQLQHVLTAMALNIRRSLAWVQATPRSQVHVSQFARLAPAA